MIIDSISVAQDHGRKGSLVHLQVFVPDVGTKDAFSIVHGALDGAPTTAYTVELTGGQSSTTQGATPTEGGSPASPPATGRGRRGGAAPATDAAPASADPTTGRGRRGTASAPAATVDAGAAPATGRRGAVAEEPKGLTIADMSRAAGDAIAAGVTDEELYATIIHISKTDARPPSVNNLAKDQYQPFVDELAKDVAWVKAGRPAPAAP